MIYAGFGERSLAYIVDILPILMLTFSIAYFFFGFDKIWHEYLDLENSTEERATFLKHRNVIRDSTFLLWILYGLVMDCSAFQGTLGKKLLGLKTVNTAGGRITFSQSLKRSTVKVVGLLPLGLGYIWAAFSEEKAGWHDLAAKTRVIKAQ